MLVLLAALYWAIIHQRGLRFVRTLCVAREHWWCEYDYPRWGVHTSVTLLRLPLCSAHRLLS
jgi:hypothetical protein